jgi:hypothetical protein
MTEPDDVRDTAMLRGWRLGACPHGTTGRDVICPECVRILTELHEQQRAEREQQRHRNAQRSG